uniref:Chitin-binding type-2 domain-containing protein n=1 Tax=Biomphalaria glabrata TaxID=6526 RepID=A0A2C9K668_BIOGL
MNNPTNLVFNPSKQPEPAYNSAQGTNDLSPNNYQPSPAFVPPNYIPTNNYPINVPNLDRYPNPIYPPAQSNQPNYDPINNYPINLPNSNNYLNPIYPSNLPDRAYYPNPSILPAPSKQPSYNPSNNYPINLPKRVYNPNPSNPPEPYNQQPYPYANSPTRNYQPGTPYVDPNEDPAFLPYNLANGFTSDAADNQAYNADDNENNEEPYDTANDAQNYNPPQTSYVAPTNRNPTITSNVAPPNTYPASTSYVDPSEVYLNELFNSDNAPTSYKENNLNCKDITVRGDYSNAQPNVPGVYPCNADLQCQTYSITGSCKGYFLCWNNESIYQECPKYQSFNATSGLCVNSNTCK